MAVSYKKLWKLLVDREMSRTELRRATGMTTTCLAKLGRDESVNIEVLARICQCLECSLSDIVEIVDDKALSFYKAFAKNAILTEESDLIRTYRLEYEGVSYSVKVTKQAANKHTVIHCAGDTVYWEQRDKEGLAGERTLLVKRPLFRREDNALLVVSGNPSAFTGLDEASKSKKGALVVLSQLDFKKFAPNEE